jgi:DNA-binding IscR family transcriptional regulator
MDQIVGQALATFRKEQCKNCITQDKCRLHRAMLLVRDETARILDGLTLADEVDLGEPLEQA